METKSETLLVIDDDPATQHLIREIFRDTGLTVETAGDAKTGLKFLDEKKPDLVLLDVMLPDRSGLETFQSIKQRDPRLPVVFITAGEGSDTPIEAMKEGAYDFLVKPLDFTHVRELVQQALEMRRRMHITVSLPDSPSDSDQSDRMVGRSPQILEVYKSVGRVAPQDVTVLIRGESGTGDLPTQPPR